MVNTIVAKNRVRGGCHHDCSGTVTSEGYILIGMSTGCTMAGDRTGVLLDENPRLFPLADNGGPTLTHALRRTSPEASCHPRRRRVTAASAGDTAACSYLAGLGVVACAGVFGRLCFASHAKIVSPASSATRLL